MQILPKYKYMYAFINTKQICTSHRHILCKHQLLYWMLLIAGHPYSFMVI